MKNTSAKIDQTIDLHQKQIELLKELKNSLQYQKSKYEIITHKESLPLRYSLFEIATRRNLCHGTMEKLNSFMRLRAIDKSQVFTRP